MKKLFAVAIAALLFCGHAFAQQIGPGPSSGGSSGIGGATSLGSCLSAAGGILNTIQCPTRTITSGPDPITASDAGKTLIFNGTVPIAESLAAASSAGLTLGFGLEADNIGTANATITPTTSTINGKSSFIVPPNTGCYIYSDSTNYQVSFASCSALSFGGNGAASLPGLLLSGSPYTGGTGTTTLPYILIQPAGTTAVTNWTTAGALFGINGTGFGGDLIRVWYSNTNSFSIQSNGTLFNSSPIQSGSGFSGVNAMKTDLFISGNNQKFTTTGAGCGTIGTTVGGAAAGTFASGVTGTCTITINVNGAFPDNAPNGVTCWVNDENTGVAGSQTGHTSATATLKVATTSGDTVSFGCMGY